MNIQDWLQSHYIAAFGELADRIRRADEEEGACLRDACIIGWDSLNEPAEGLVEWDDLNKNPTQQGTTLKKGTYPTPAQSLRLGMGKAQTVDCWDFGTFGPKRDGKVTIDPKGRKIWADPDVTGTQGGELPDGTHPRWGWKRDVTKWPLGTCIWAQHGVWDIESGFVLRPDYFKYHPATGIEVGFMTDFWLPHFKAYSERLRKAHPTAILFVQPPVFALPPSVDEEILKGRCAYTGHYYDGLTLITKHWNWFNADSLGVLRGKYKSPLQAVKFGERAIRKSIMEQIKMLKADAKLITAPPCSSSSSSTPLSSSPSSRPSSPPPPPPSCPPTSPNEYPTVIGEIGTPFDMDKKYSYYSSKGDYANQEKALDASLNACDGYNNVAYTIWTYIPRGHTHEWGDAWNGEDLSLWSPDDLRCTYTCQTTYREGKGYFGFGWKKRKRGSGDSRDSRDSISSGRSAKSPIPARNESQAVLLGKSTGGLGSKNPSVLSVNTLSSSPCAGDDSPAVLTPAEEVPPVTLTKKPSIALSARTAVENGQVGSSLPKSVDPEVQVEATPSSGSSTLSSDREMDPDDDPYDFLTDGARAVRAFCRPRPVKVFGNVVDTKFEISKAVFKCVIQAPESTATSIVGEGEEVATEIYLPLVHFASREVLEESKARWDPHSQRSKSKVKEVGLELPKEYAAPGWQNNVSSPYVDGEVKPGRSSVSSERGTLLEGTEERDDLLDVEVKVSCGRWRIKGQTLFWCYPPSSAGEVEYTIEVKRRGGAIKVKKGGWVEPKSWRRTRRRWYDFSDSKTAKRNWCEKLCDSEGCIIM